MVFKIRNNPDLMSVTSVARKIIEPDARTLSPAEMTIVDLPVCIEAATKSTPP